MVEDIVGCKWSLVVLGLVRRGVRRPGALERSVPGLTAKVLNERLRKLVRFGVLERKSFDQIPPRVEYRLTPLGTRFVRILDMIDRLESDVSANSLRTDSQRRDSIRLSRATKRKKQLRGGVPKLLRDSSVV